MPTSGSLLLWEYCAQWRTKWRMKWQRWLDNRIPRADRVYLTHKNIFILPSAAGYAFLVLLAVMTLLATSYQNTLIYGLIFWLGAVFFVGIHHSFRNLSGLTLKAGAAPTGFLGDIISLPVLVCAAKQHGHQAVMLGFDTMHRFDVLPAGEQALQLPWQGTHRGWARPGRIRVSSRYPLGFFEAWSWIALDYAVLLYPKVELEPWRSSASGDQADENSSLKFQQGIDDFQGLRVYQAGDNLRHMAWKQLARRQGLLTKTFVEPLVQSRWLDWQVLHPLEIEKRLSVLCGWVLMAHEAELEYGLRLPNLVLLPKAGIAHRDQCLRALALFGSTEAT